MKHLLLTFFCCLSLNAKAALIFDNGFDLNAVQASTKTSTSTTEFTLWDDFSLTQASSLTSLSFLMNGNANLGPTFIEIRSDNAGELGSQLFRTAIFGTDITQTSLGGFFSRFDVTLPSFDLDAGNYWISFTNISFQGTAVGSFGNYAMKQSVRASYIPLFAQGDFQVPGEYVPFQLMGTTTSVSEPPLAALFAIIVFTLFRRHRQLGSNS